MRRSRINPLHTNCPTTQYLNLPSYLRISSFWHIRAKSLYELFTNSLSNKLYRVDKNLVFSSLTMNGFFIAIPRAKSSASSSKGDPQLYRDVSGNGTYIFFALGFWFLNFFLRITVLTRIDWCNKIPQRLSFGLNTD